MKTFKPNNARVVAIAALFLILTACGKGSKQSQAPEKECQAAGVQKDKSISESISIDDEEICPVDPDSPYWYDPKQEEVELSEDGDTLFRFPRIKKGGDYEVPQSVRYIYERAFQGCRNLRSLTVPRTVKHIEMAPFENCGKLEELVLLCQLDTLPFRFAGGCGSLKDIFLADEKPPFITEGDDEEEEQEAFSLNFYDVSTDSCTVHVPRGSEARYRNTPGWRLFRHFAEN